MNERKWRLKADMQINSAAPTGKAALRISLLIANRFLSQLCQAPRGLPFGIVPKKSLKPWKTRGIVLPRRQSRGIRPVSKSFFVPGWKTIGVTEFDLRLFFPRGRKRKKKKRKEKTFFYCSCVQTCPKYFILLRGTRTYCKQTKQNNCINSIRRLLFKVC